MNEVKLSRQPKPGSDDQIEEHDAEPSKKIVLEESFNKSRQALIEIVSIADKMQGLIQEVREANDEHVEWMVRLATMKKGDHNV